MLLRYSSPVSLVLWRAAPESIKIVFHAIVVSINIEYYCTLQARHKRLQGKAPQLAQHLQ